MIRHTLASRSIAATAGTHRHRNQKIDVRGVVCRSADLQRIFKHVKWNVIAVITVDVILVGTRRVRGSENYLEITVTRTIELALAGPPIERLLVMGPGGTPVHLTAASPEEI